MDIYIDFDGTITEPGDFSEAIQKPPQSGSIKAINALFTAGHTITIYSCRSNPNVVGRAKMKLLSFNPTALEKQWATQTLEEEMVGYLKHYGINYHKIQHDKPHYQIIIDDRAKNPSEGWDKILESIPH